MTEIVGNPVGNKCGWLCSSQNISWVRDSVNAFSPGAIEINSFSHDVFTKTVSLWQDTGLWKTENALL